ncbi:MAG: serine/threonine-protein kinase [Vicinamibacterales bacterium]
MTDRYDLDALRTLNRLVDEALAIEPASRTTWIDQLSAEYAAFKPRLQAMLDALESYGFDAFLQSMPAVEIEGDDDLDAADSLAAGALVGAYRLVRPLARGGQGVVWLAERADGLLERAVAIKLPHAQARHPRLAERLARERAILARLEHPHIARLYDAGVMPSGRPFLAMEFVDGQPIDAFVASRGLDVPAILRLLVAVADAVAYAHGALVIHRDLKPSNVLVDGVGQPKLLDFGIAALLDAEGDALSGLTGDGGRALTLAYASPEQVERRPLGVGTDVYSLGVLAYELLTGRRPYALERESAGALENAILTQDLLPPSRAATDAGRRAVLAGDLDAILVKALRKAPSERYPTVVAFADDLRRHLDGRPVLAQPDRWAYRAAKFVRRNRVPVAATATATIVLAVAAGVAWRQTAAARAANQQAASAESFLSGLLERSNIDAAGSAADLLVVDLLEKARTDVLAMQTTPAMRVRLLNLVADGLRGFGRTAEFDDTTQRALEAAASLPADHPERVKAGFLRANALEEAGKEAEATAALDVVFPGIEARADLDPLLYLRALTLRVDIAIIGGRLDEAVRLARDLTVAAERHFGPAHAETAAAFRALASATAQTHDVEASLATARDALARTLQAHAATPHHPWVIISRELVARALANAGDVAGAVDEMQRVLELKIAQQGPESRSVGITTANLSGNQYRLGRLAEAIANNTRALAILDRHLDPDSMDYVNVRNVRAQLLITVRQGQAAIDAASRGLAATTKYFGPTHVMPITERATIALGHGYEGHRDEAARLMAVVLTDMRAAGPVMTGVVLMAARLEALLGHDAAAARLFDETLASDRESTRLAAQVQAERAVMLRDPAAAVPALERALASLRAAYTVETPWHADAHTALARHLLAQGRAGDAAPHAEAAATLWQSLNPGSPWHAEAVRLRDRARAAGPAAATSRATR